MATENSQAKIITCVRDGVRIVKFNRPNRKNAINTEMYLQITNILNKDAVDDTVVATIFTGTGEYYSSGNDLTAVDYTEDYELLVENRTRMVEAFIAAFINYPKLLIAVVNGPAIGVAVTTLGLCDVVYASDRATFATPFVRLGICPEGCSSYLFPQIMGRSKANEVLVLGHTLLAEEAFRFGLVSEVVPHDKLEELFSKLLKYGKLPLESVKCAKRLLISAELKENLHAANKRECDALRQCFHSQEFIDAVTSFMSRKSKL